MKQDDIEKLQALVQVVGAADWKVGPTPMERDTVAKRPANTPTATVFAQGRPVASFWSYMHNGPDNAAYVTWMANNATRILAGTLSSEEVSAGAAMLAGLSYGDWFPGPTPFYMRFGDGDAITLRSSLHTEEIATLWTPLVEESASLICWFVSAGADLLAHASPEGATIVLDTMLPVMERRMKVTLDTDVRLTAQELVGELSALQVPVSNVLLAMTNACYQVGRSSDDGALPRVLTSQSLRTAAMKTAAQVA